MSNPSPQPSGAKQSGELFWKARAAILKQQLMERRTLTTIAQPGNMNSSPAAPEQYQQQKQPPPDQVGPTQTKSTAVTQARPISGLSYKLPDDRATPEETSKSKKQSILNAPEQPTPHASVQSSTAMTGKLMEKPSPSTASKTAGNNVNDAPKAANDVRRDVNAPSGTNDRADTTVQEKPDAGTTSKVQQEGDSAARKETRASRSSIKTVAVPEDDSNSKLSTEEGEITSKTSAPLRKNPVQEPPPQHASREKKSPTRVSTGTRTAPTKARNERRASRPHETRPVPKDRRGPDDTAPSRSYESRSEGRHGHGRASSSARARMTDHDGHTTWEAYKEPPLDHHHAYPRAGREQSARPAAPAAPRLTRDGDREVERLASHHPDLRDWLESTGWHVPDYRERQLDRVRRMAEIAREGSQLKEEYERENARLKEYGEPAIKANHRSGAGPCLMPLYRAPNRRADGVERPEYRMLGPYSVTDGLKRQRGEESDDDRGFSPKYHRNNLNHRGSRAGHHGSRGSHRGGREGSRYWHDRDRRQGGRSPPPRSFHESSPPWSLPQRDPRASYRFSSPVGHPLPREDVNAGRSIDRYMIRDRSPSRRLSPRLSISPPRVRGHRASHQHNS